MPGYQRGVDIWLPIVVALGEAATAKVYSFTVAGADVHNLNPYFLPVSVDAGEVQTIDTGGPYEGNRYFEASLALPVGAKVTSVAIYYKSGNFQGACDQFAFGSYSPSTRVAQPVFVASPPLATTASTFTKTGQPLVTSAPGRRYVIDWLGDHEGSGATPSADFGTFYGATVKYTCTAPRVPWPPASFAFRAAQITAR